VAISAIRQSVEPLLRRAFHLYWRFSRGLTLGVRAVVLDQSGRVFLIKHSYVAGWHLPGGGVEPGETVLDALARELKEEGNIDIVEPPAFHGLYFNAVTTDRDHVALFVVRAFRQDAPPRPDHEIVAHGFFAPHDMPQDTTAGTRARIAEVVYGMPAAQHW
jgi:8-oxo-dGTP pyrophosphatase MutT (NUDIX family)